MHRITPLVQTPFTERNGIGSPDGRWLAYEANDSGQSEIYVRPFPEVNLGHWQVSTGDGTRPLRARNGQELFYVAASGALMRVGVDDQGRWRIGSDRRAAQHHRRPALAGGAETSGAYEVRRQKGKGKREPDSLHDFTCYTVFRG